MPDTRSDYSLGILLLVASAVTFSTAGIFTKGVALLFVECLVDRSIHRLAALERLVSNCIGHQVTRNSPRPLK